MKVTKGKIGLKKTEAVLDNDWKESDIEYELIKKFLEDRYPIKVDVLKNVDVEMYVDQTYTERHLNKGVTVVYYTGLGDGPWDVQRYRTEMDGFVAGMKAMMKLLLS